MLVNCVAYQEGRKLADITIEQMMGRWSTRLAPQFANFAQIRDHGRVLDVGCGTGSLVQYLADATERSAIVGVDPSDAFIEYSRSRFTGSRFSFDVGNAMELPYSNGHFDQSLYGGLIFFFANVGYLEI